MNRRNKKTGSRIFNQGKGNIVDKKILPNINPHGESGDTWDTGQIGNSCDNCGETIFDRGTEICCSPVGADPGFAPNETRSGGGTTDPGDDIIGGCYWVDCTSSDVTSSPHMPGGDTSTSGQARGCFQYQSCGSCNNAGCWWRNDMHDNFTPYGAGYGGTNHQQGGCHGAACEGGVFGSCCTMSGDCIDTAWSTAQSNLIPVFGCPGQMVAGRLIEYPNPEGTNVGGDDGNESYTYSNVDHWGNCRPCPSSSGLARDGYTGGVICGDCCDGSPMEDQYSTCPDPGVGETCNGSTTTGGCYSFRELTDGTLDPVCQPANAAQCASVNGVLRIGFNCGQCDDYGDNCDCCLGTSCPPTCTGAAPFSSMTACYNDSSAPDGGGLSSDTNSCCNPTTGECDLEHGMMSSPCPRHSSCTPGGTACTDACIQPGCWCSMRLEAEDYHQCTDRLLDNDNAQCTSIETYTDPYFGQNYDPKTWTGNGCYWPCDGYWGPTTCEVYGDFIGAEGKTANEMCCRCGGGDNPLIDGGDAFYVWEGFLDCNINEDNYDLQYRNEDGTYNYKCAMRGGFDTWLHLDWPYQEGDGACDDADLGMPGYDESGAIFPNLDCAAFEWDGGDCDFPGPQCCNLDPYDEFSEPDNCAMQGNFCLEHCDCPLGMYCDGYAMCWESTLDDMLNPFACGCWFCGDYGYPCEDNDDACGDGTCWDGTGVERCEAMCDGDCYCANPLCSDCDIDFSNYGSECCDTAWDEFGITCADLEANYNWDCAGCNCPGDSLQHSPAGGGRYSSNSTSVGKGKIPRHIGKSHVGNNINIIPIGNKIKKGRKK